MRNKKELKSILKKGKSTNHKANSKKKQIMWKDKITPLNKQTIIESWQTKPKGKVKNLEKQAIVNKWEKEYQSVKSSAHIVFSKLDENYKKNISKLKMDENQVKIGKASSLKKKTIQKNMETHVKNGYTESEAASLESNPITLSKNSIISGYFCKRNTMINNFYTSSDQIHEQKKERDERKQQELLMLKNINIVEKQCPSGDDGLTKTDSSKNTYQSNHWSTNTLLKGALLLGLSVINPNLGIAAIFSYAANKKSDTNSNDDTSSSCNLK